MIIAGVATAVTAGATHRALHGRSILSDAASVPVSADTLVMTQSGLGATCVGAKVDPGAFINVLQDKLELFSKEWEDLHAM